MSPCESSIFQAHHRRVHVRGKYRRGMTWVPKSPAHKKKYEEEIAAMDRAEARYDRKQGTHLEARIGSILEEAKDANKEWAKHMRFYPGDKSKLTRRVNSAVIAAKELNDEWFSNKNKKPEGTRRRERRA